MNAPSVDVAQARRAMGGLKPPPPFPRHPHLRALQSGVRGVIAALDKASAYVSAITPERLYDDDGSLLTSEETLREMSEIGEMLLRDLRGPMWLPIQRDADRHFAALGRRLRAEIVRACDCLSDFLLTMDLVIGTGFAARQGISFDPVAPEPRPVSPNPRAPTDQEISAARERARGQDGVVDPFALALELSELRPSTPDLPRSDDPHFRFRGDPQMMRAIRGHD